MKTGRVETWKGRSPLSLAFPNICIFYAKKPFKLKKGPLFIHSKKKKKRWSPCTCDYVSGEAVPPTPSLLSHELLPPVKKGEQKNINCYRASVLTTHFSFMTILSLLISWRRSYWGNASINAITHRTKEKVLGVHITHWGGWQGPCR